MSLIVKTIPQGKILVAVSGGVDSCVLLHLLQNKADKENLIIAHVNHNTRGEESDEDELFVKKLAKGYGILFYSNKLKNKPKNEEEARDMRYKYLFAILESSQAKYIALAHHRSDQIETLMLQMTRGTYAFSPMKEINDIKWRPLLNYSKSEVIDYAKKNHLKWREDATNNENDFSRNRLRNIVIPELKRINSNFENVFLQFAQGVYNKNTDIETYVETLIAQLSQELDDKKCISAESFLKLPGFLQSSIIKKLQPQLYQKHIEEVLKMIKKGVGKKSKHGFFIDKGIVSYSR
ncbi:tRNA lysidine(34) synthetase TilS [Candidatus Peregrinibacteria bacterium]|jgi:tRNA(Ile)-lysidine synthase|nr:tRNA lysidine(34) synthetase TilS [Candidatus Peregrinibacteria bacterium]